MQERLRALRLSIASRDIARGLPPYIVAEMAGEHLGDFDRAVAIMAAAKDAGAEAVKIQVFDPARIAAQRGGADKVVTWQGQDLTLGAIYARTHTPLAWLPDLFAGASELGITLFASVFHEDYGFDELARAKCPAYKISSFELLRLPLIRRASATGKPLILSTGMASDNDIRAAIGAAERQPGLALLHCISAYPAPTEDMNLRQPTDWHGKFGFDVLGLSDHTLSSMAAIVATALGTGAIIEKHITLSKADGGLDAGYALEPDAFAAFVADVNEAYASLGYTSSGRPPSEAASLQIRAKKVA